ncbi:MAG: hypothetical protein H6659_02420 [Ardenticatenaceae bacterium]|nr:hypothetical protein [Ardenticatenaceae bacterium]
MSEVTPQQLKEALQTHFNLEELSIFAFEVGIPYEDLGGSGRSGKALALVQYAQRHSKFDQVVEAVKAKRPSVNWDAPTIPTNQPTNPPTSQPASVQYHFHGQVVGSAIGGGSVQAENIAGRDIIIGQIPQNREEFNDQLAALRQLLEQAVANGEIPDERDAADVVEDVNDALAEAQSDEPRTSRLKRYLENTAEVLDGAAKTATAAGKVGLAVLKAAPIAAALVKAVQVLF